MEQQYDRRAVWSWCLYDFANSSFTTLIVTFVYATYFTQQIAADEIAGTTLWSRAVTITALAVAALSPFLGAMADRGGYRKMFLLATTIIAAFGSAGLYWVLPGQVVAALFFFTVANIAFETGMVFYNAFLPDIAPADRIGRISGYGWGLGYVGGLLALIVALATLVQPEVPWFGFAKDGEHVRATNLLVAGWYVLFSLPLFFWVKEDRTGAESSSGSLIKESYAQLRGTFVEIRKYRQIVRFLIARLVYNDALVTIFAFGGIYAAGTFGFTFEEILYFGIALNVAAGTGAFAMGVLDDKLGGKKSIEISLWFLTGATLLAIVAPNKTAFWIAGILVGVFSGPNQSSSRSLMGRFVPPSKENEFFGFFAFSGKATAFLGPLLLGTLTAIFGSQRAGISVVLVLFAIGLVLLRAVDEEEGVRAAKRP